MANHLPSLFVAPSDRGGRGVFSSRAIVADTTIELAPVIVLDPDDMEIIHDTHLHDYYFLWGEEGCAIALGYGSLYNHAKNPNADFYMDFEMRHICFFARRDIRAGEEITISYNDEADERTRLWFEEK
ncbi:MAG: SET domain-containing protein [Lewinella sp.]|nr:SET domain-containing protein [Lewinella sp.]